MVLLAIASGACPGPEPSHDAGPDTRPDADQDPDLTDADEADEPDVDEPRPDGQPPTCAEPGYIMATSQESPAHLEEP